MRSTWRSSLPLCVGLLLLAQWTSAVLGTDDDPGSNEQPDSEVFLFEGNKVLLFTVQAGAGYSAVDTFLDSSTVYPKPTSELPSVYRSSVIDSLSTSSASNDKSYIVAEMRVQDRPVAQVMFDISTNREQLTKENWFTKERLVSSVPYDIGKDFFYFSIRGDSEQKRSFFISFSHGGCALDTAFWVVLDTEDPCSWGKKNYSGKGPTLIYTTSRETTLEAGAQYDADRFLIYLM